MAEIKWIKITTDIFDDEKMKIIDTLPDRDALLVIWFKLLALTGKKNESGMLFLSPKMPYTDEMLATVFNRPLTTVRLALETFQAFDMIEIAENQVISVINWEKHQNVDGMDKVRDLNRKRVAKYRAKKMMLENNADMKQEEYDLKESCSYCGSKENLTVDHIIPLSKGGNDSSLNKTTACKSCNSSKKDKELTLFLNDNIDNKLLKLDVISIINDEKLKQYVDFKGGKFVTLHVTESNALDKIRLDKNRLDKDKNNIKDNINELSIGSDLKVKLCEYVDYRKEIKKTLKTMRSITTTLNKIGTDFTDEQHLIESIDNSIANEYQGIFPTKKRSFAPKQKPVFESGAARRLRELEENNMFDAEVVE